MEKINLVGLTVAQLENFTKSLNEPKYRAKQIYHWLYQSRVHSFPEMTNLPLSFREKLNEYAFLEQCRVVTSQTSEIDETKKFLFELSDGKRIETVLIPPRSTAVDARDRLTLCISSQIGCALDCKFCATATMGFQRNLTVSEILNQFLAAEKCSNKSITNIVFMGMGEPMLNYENVMNAVDIFTDQQGIGISSRRITVSTAGYAEFIKRMADENRKPKLALSLHSLHDEIRSKLMPINKKHNVQELISSLEYYIRKTRKNIMLEYIVFQGLNDSDEDVKLLTQVSQRLNCRVNLIPFHAIHFSNHNGNSMKLQGASKETIEIFWKKLRAKQVTAFIRHSAGVDIDAACGQLAVNNLPHEIETRN